MKNTIKLLIRKKVDTDHFLKRKRKITESPCIRPNKIFACHYTAGHCYKYLGLALAVQHHQFPPYFLSPQQQRQAFLLTIIIIYIYIYIVYFCRLFRLHFSASPPKKKKTKNEQQSAAASSPLHEAFPL